MFKIILVTLLTFATVSCTSSSNFKTTTVDMGIVVSDIDASLKFYQDILGFKEISTFVASPQIAGDAGLLNYKSIKVHVLSLDGDKGGTKVKLMQATKPAQKQNQQFIDSTYGVSYMTIFVNDMSPILKKLAHNNIVVLVKGPVDLKTGNSPATFLGCVKDPDGNFIELVGTKIEK